MDLRAGCPLTLITTTLAILIVMQCWQTDLVADRPRAEDAVVDLINALAPAKTAGMKDALMQADRELQRGAQWRVDYISSENSMGFQAPQEASRILGEAIDLARKGQLEILKK